MNLTRARVCIQPGSVQPLGAAAVHEALVEEGNLAHVRRYRGQRTMAKPMKLFDVLRFESLRTLPTTLDD